MVPFRYRNRRRFRFHDDVADGDVELDSVGGEEAAITVVIAMAPLSVEALWEGDSYDESTSGELEDWIAVGVFWDVFGGFGAVGDDGAGGWEMGGSGDDATKRIGRYIHADEVEVEVGSGGIAVTYFDTVDVADLSGVTRQMAHQLCDREEDGGVVVFDCSVLVNAEYALHKALAVF